MLRRNAPKDTKVYHTKWGLFGKIESDDHYPDDMVKVEFADFLALCYRKNLTEVNDKFD